MDAFLAWAGGPIGILGLVLIVVAIREFWRGDPVGGIIWALIGLACLAAW